VVTGDPVAPPVGDVFGSDSAAAPPVGAVVTGDPVAPPVGCVFGSDLVAAPPVGAVVGSDSVTVPPDGTVTVWVAGGTPGGTVTV
jgi:hypothetical protein